MKKLIYILLPVLILTTSCEQFLEYKDKDKLIPNQLSHYDELIFGEIMKKQDMYEMSFMNVMTDDLESVVSAPSSGNRTDGRLNYASYYKWAPLTQYTPEGVEKKDVTWGAYYHRILMCNIIESELNKFEEDIKGQRSRMLGEVKFFRAMSYFFLVNLYGEPFKSTEQAVTALGVPINREISIQPNTYKRSTLKEVYDLIETDLTEAIVLLKKGEQLNSLYRPSEHIARLFLARTYLFTKQWQKTVDVCNEFLANSKASIETLTNLKTYKAGGLCLYMPSNLSILFSWGESRMQDFATSSSSQGRFELNRSLMSLYATDDIRKEAFFYVKNSTNQPNKMNVFSPKMRYYNYRVEEIYFSRAEAYIELGGADNINKAMQDLTTIRKERIPTNYAVTATTADQARSIFRDEKRREFCFEDQRWFDIRRWNIEVVHILQNISGDPAQFETFKLPAGSPNYILPLPLDVEGLNKEIERFERVETLVPNN